MRRFMALVCTAAFMTACASSRSTYVREGAPAKELTWRYENELQIFKGGVKVSDEGWSGLSDAISCVPAASELASAARSRKVTAPIMLTTSLVTLVGGTAASLVVLFEDTDENLAPSLAILGGALVSGIVFGAIAGNMYAGAETRGIDAVNMYNDQFRSRPECRGTVPAAP